MLLPNGLVPLVYAFSAIRAVVCQSDALPNSWPQNYTGIPSGDYSTAWQEYFRVSDPLPGVPSAFAVDRSFAGNIKVDRSNHPNDTLFFWAVEKVDGSLTSASGASDEPWLIWLNGGPGSSSLLGFLSENGPLHFDNNGGLVDNDFSWDKLADAVWVDQPVGTGYSTADSTGYVADEDQMGQDFLGFLSNLVKVFPSLATRPLYLTGESYAGTYIPYIAKAVFSSSHPPVKLVKLSIGDGSLNDVTVNEDLPTVQIIETYPELINFDPEVLAYFREQTHLCGYDLNLTYPQTGGHFPTLRSPFTGAAFNQQQSNSLSATRFSGSLASFAELTARRFVERSEDQTLAPPQDLKREDEVVKREERRKGWKRDLSARANGTIDPWYGCDLLDEMADYAVNFSFPWALPAGSAFDTYDIPDALGPEVPNNPDANAVFMTNFLNENRTRQALHAPTSKGWAPSFSYPFGNKPREFVGVSPFGDPSPSPMSFLSELATNASLHNVSIVLYSGNDDSLISHRGTEVTIQNMTFGGIQGFSRQPSTPWYDDSGNLAGIVHQERGLTYVLVLGAGHAIPYWKPATALVLLREFILGSNTTGLVTDPSVPAIGGEDSALAPDGILPGTNVIFWGSGTTASSTVIPSATLASWSAAEARLTASPTAGQ